MKETYSTSLAVVVLAIAISGHMVVDSLQTLRPIAGRSQPIQKASYAWKTMTIPPHPISVPFQAISLGTTLDGDEAGAENDDESSSKPRRRRKRKQTTTDSATTSSNSKDAEYSVKEASSTPVSPVMEGKPRDDTPVQLQVINVKELVGGGSDSMSSYPSPLTAAKRTTMSTKTEPFSASSARSGASFGSGDSLEQLLEDARRMKEEQGGDAKNGDSGGILSDEEGRGVKELIRNILSTIVTADFFLVCGFLLWFVAGIVWRAAFHDDSVQISFNNNFETLVQPALGVLMIAALAGNFINEDGDPDVMV